MPHVFASLPSIPVWYLNLPDHELGVMLLTYFVAANAEADGVDREPLPESYYQHVVALLREIPDDAASEQNSSLLLVLRMAARGNFAEAGKRYRQMVDRQAYAVAMQAAVSRYDDNTRIGAKVRQGRRKGHTNTFGTPDEKAIRYARYQAEVDLQRAENPGLKRDRICQIAALKFGCNAKTIKRHTRW